MTTHHKPYKSYKESGVPWLGTMPEHWQVLPGKACYCEKYVPNTGLVQNTILSLSYGQLVVKPQEKLHGLVPTSFETYQVIDPGDIVVRPTDLQNDWNSLRFGLSKHRGAITSAYICLRTKNTMSAQYGHLLLHTYDLKKVFYGLGSGLRQNLDWRDFKYLPCVVPTPEEQTAITHYLDYIDKRIHQYIRVKRKLITLLEEKKQAIIHHAVTCGLDLKTRFKPSGVAWFDEIPAHWEVLNLRRVIYKAIDGPHYSPNYLDKGIPFLSARNIKEDQWSLADAKYISEEDYKEFCKRVTPEIGDVLYTKGGTTGIARVVDLDFKFQVWVHVAVLKVRRNKVIPKYLALALNSHPCYEQAQLFTRGATNQDLGLGRMKSIVFALPPIAEQQAILNMVDEKTSAFQQAIRQARTEIELLHEYHKRLIADVVTGKFDVREAAKKLPVIEDIHAPIEELQELGEDTDEVDEVLTDEVNEEGEGDNAD